MGEAIRITGPVREICERLGLDYTNVSRLDVYPTHVDADVYATRDGRKHVDEDTGKAAIETLTFKVRT